MGEKMVVRCCRITCVIMMCFQSSPLCQTDLRFLLDLSISAATLLPSTAMVRGMLRADFDRLRTDSLRVRYVVSLPIR